MIFDDMIQIVRRYENITSPARGITFTGKNNPDFIVLGKYTGKGTSSFALKINIIGTNIVRVFVRENIAAA